MPVVGDQQMPEVEVAVSYRPPRRRRERGRGRHDALRLGRRLPDPVGAEFREAFARHRNALAHVRAAHRVDRQRVDPFELEQLRRMQRPQELAERPGRPRPLGVGRCGMRGLLPGEERRAEERPREGVAGPACERRLGNRQRQSRREPRQHGELPGHGRHGDLAARETERPPPVDEPDGVVPTLTERLERRELELVELIAKQPPDETSIDHDLGLPLAGGHYATPGRYGRGGTGVRCRASSGPIFTASRDHADARSASIIRPTRSQSRNRRSVPQLET